MSTHTDGLSQMGHAIDRLADAWAPLVAPGAAGWHQMAIAALTLDEITALAGVLRAGAHERVAARCYYAWALHEPAWQEVLTPAALDAQLSAITDELDTVSEVSLAHRADTGLYLYRAETGTPTGDATGPAPEGEATIRREFPELTLTTPEGVAYTPTVTAALDPTGDVADLVVSLTARYATGDAHRLALIPSTATDEGEHTGNVFVYADDDPATHFAWHHPTS